MSILSAQPTSKKATRRKPGAEDQNNRVHVKRQFFSRLRIGPFVVIFNTTPAPSRLQPDLHHLTSTYKKPSRLTLSFPHLSILETSISQDVYRRHLPGSYRHPLPSNSRYATTVALQPPTPLHSYLPIFPSFTPNPSFHPPSPPRSPPH
jgi:hypothetical protein